MHHRIIARVLGGLLALLACTMVVPLAAAWHYQEPLRPWGENALIALLLGALLLWLGRRAQPDQLGLREGLVITTLAWSLGSAVAAIGLWRAVPGLPYVDAWFELVSGMTTTGATVFGGWTDAHGVAHGTAIVDLPRACLVWRSLSQLLGGIGIVVLSIALLPLIASGAGYQLYRSEVTGINADRLAPRLIDTARILVGFYLFLVLTLALALRLTGETWFDALNHAACTISTGGFSTYDTSATGLANPAAEWALIVGMFIGGLNFALIITALRGDVLRLWRSEEARLYLGLILCAWLALAGLVGLAMPAYDGRLPDLLRDTLFQVVSIGTSTGFGSGFDATPHGWEDWPSPAQFILLLLMIGGACAGSTSGGTKLVRLLVAAKLMRRELRRHHEPNRLTPITIDGRPLGDTQILHVTGLLLLFVLSWLIGGLLLALGGVPGLEAAALALSCLGNSGPGVGDLGIAHNFGPLPTASKLICMALMLLGRLEYFGVLMTVAWIIRRR